MYLSRWAVYRLYRVGHPVAGAVYRVGHPVAGLFFTNCVIWYKNACTFLEREHDLEVNKIIPHSFNL